LLTMTLFVVVIVHHGVVQPWVLETFIRLLRRYGLRDKKAGRLHAGQSGNPRPRPPSTASSDSNAKCLKWRPADPQATRAGAVKPGRTYSTSISRRGPGTVPQPQTPPTVNPATVMERRKAPGERHLPRVQPPRRNPHPSGPLAIRRPTDDGGVAGNQTVAVTRAPGASLRTHRGSSYPITSDENIAGRLASDLHGGVTVTAPVVRSRHRHCRSA